MRVLVADMILDRAKLHAGACTARGYVVDRVENGAAGLELALENVPDVVICPVDLPVIDGERLAGILRGNPRTQQVSFLFLVQDELDAPMVLDPRDGTIVAPWHPADVLDHIDAFLERHGRFEQDRSDTEIEGKLTQISLVDLLQIFQMNKRSGTVQIWRSGAPGSGTVLVRDGQVVDAAVPLAGGGKVVGEKALFRLLTWREGRFEFVPGAIADPGRIDKPSRALLLEGVRQMDEWHQLRRELPSEETRLSLAMPHDQVPGRDNRLTAEVVAAVEACSRVGEVVDRCPLPDYQVLCALHDLLQRGVIAPQRGEVSEGQGDRNVALDDEQRRRLQEWTVSQRPRPGRVLKLLVAVATPAQTEGVLRALREFPDFVAQSRVPGEALGGLTTLGQFEVGEGLDVRVIAIPASQAYAPLREVAAHGMVAALVVPRAPDSTALDEVEDIARRLSDLRPGSVAHLFLCDQTHDELSEDARETLKKLDSSSVFLLPAEPAPERLSVLREALSRILP